jgi:agmatinase
LSERGIKQMTRFDPDGVASADSGIFGLPYTLEESKLVLLPIPWEATTSYGGGTSEGPSAIFNASKQVDLYDFELGTFYEDGITWVPESDQVKEWNELAKEQAQLVIKAGGLVDGDQLLAGALKQVNELSAKVNEFVYSETKRLLEQNKIVGLVGGDHSCPFGAIKAYLEKYPKMGVLHFDAHADLREAYEGFDDSHASIMFNVLKRTKLEKLVQVGIRDFGEAEFDLIQSSKGRAITHFDQELADRKLEGEAWSKICDAIIKDLPNEVYVSFDIDGLDPRLCPHTGTPVPGGLSFQEATFLIKKVVQSERKIVGFDLNEVAPGPIGEEWDANVGARLLYKLCGWALKS